MKQFLVAIVILTSITCNAQKQISWSEIQSQRFGKETIYKSQKNKLINGLYTVASNNGSYSEIYFNKGKINGTRKNYNADEKLVSTQSYVNGKADGEWLFYDKNETVKAIENYKEGLKTGKWWKKIYINGSFYISEAFYENDIPTGTWIETWGSGLLKEERIFNGKGTYIQKEYYANKKLKHQKSYKNFLLDGEQLLYSKAGVLLKKELFSDDVLEKKETFFDNGRSDQVYNLKNGKLHGAFIDYKRSGAKSYEGFYENGYKSGVFKKYMENTGWLYYETTYKDDIANGPHKTYYRSKLVEQEGNYLNGTKNGVWKFYDITGKLIREVEYDKGTEIKRKEYNR